jgi:hypothetical protein
MPVTITGSHVRRVLAVVLVVAAGAVVAFAVGRAVRDDDPFESFVDTGSFQAVVLANDRVYFGHLRDHEGGFYELTDVYFLRDRPATAGAPTSTPTRQVVSLRGESHTPTDSMLIARDKVLAVENLDRRSAVLATIKRLETQR